MTMPGVVKGVKKYVVAGVYWAVNSMQYLEATNESKDTFLEIQFQATNKVIIK